jgi:hypothetical protein
MKAVVVAVLALACVIGVVVCQFYNPYGVYGGGRYQQQESVGGCTNNFLFQLNISIFSPIIYESATFLLPSVLKVNVYLF